VKLPTSSRNQLASAIPEMFVTLSSGNLKAFIHVRKFPSSAAHGKWPKKGKIGLAEETLISIAYALRGAVYTLKSAAAVLANAAAAAAPVPPLVVTAAVGLSSMSGNLPSVLLLDLRWLSSVLFSLHGCSEAQVNQSLTAADRERADFLLQLLFQRLKNHKAARVMELPKRQSWVFDWVEENLAPVAAIALAFGHIKKTLPRPRPRPRFSRRGKG